MAPSAQSYTSLIGRTVLITGASSGIGEAAAHAFAAAGANLVLTARRKDRLDLLCRALVERGTRAVCHAGDATQEATALACIQLALDTFGTLDILINNAGIGNYKPLVETSLAEYDEVLNANLRSGFLFSRHSAPHMIAAHAGIILFISSIAGLQGAANESVYCASKFAQVGFSQALDAELRPHGIKVGVLCPGGVKTEFALGHGRTEASIRESTMMQAGEVADAIVYACRQPPNVRIPQLSIRHMG